MNKNMGTIDRIARFIIAAIITFLYFTNQISGILGIVLLIFAGVLVLTSFISICPIYLLFGFKTNRTKKQAH